MNYKGYFKDIRSCDQYCVYIIGDTANTADSAFTEVLLAGNEPFVVRYDTNKTPFEPVRTSTATIKLVHNNYLEDIMTPVARSTQIKLKNVTQNTWEWVGYLVPRVYDASYVNEYETFELEAADCLSSLQYVLYTDDSAYTKNIVTFKSIIDNACDECGLLDGYYWGRNKRLGPNSNSTVVTPDMLKISEQNFFFSDTDESWDYLTVIEEMCRYLGFTCMQFKTRLYFVDYQVMHDNDNIYVSWYPKANSYVKGADSYLTNGAYTVTKDSYMASNASISFEPVYNKCVVKANFYACDGLIPSIFDDAFLTNRRDPNNFYANVEILPESPDPAQFPSKIKPNERTKYKNEKKENDKGKKVDALDSDYRYFHRLYDHKYWESNYYTSGGTQASLSEYQLSSKTITRNYIGGTIVDLGCVRKNYISQYNQYIVPNKLDYDRYLCLSCKCNTANTSTHFDTSIPIVVDDSPLYVLFRSKPGAIAPCMTSTNAFLVINFSMIWERYENRTYINPDWCTDDCNVGWWQRNFQLDYMQRAVGAMRFRVKVGDKYWNGSNWVTGNTSFYVTTKREDEDIDRWNTEESTLNNISWEEEISAEGYKIPLMGVDMVQGVSIEILRPYFQFVYVKDNWKCYEWNQYCWVKDLSIKVVEKGHENDQESDVVYECEENQMNPDAVNELGDITVKFTTYNAKTKAAYSNVILYSGGTNSLLQYIYEPSLSNLLQAPERNIVEKYVSQYSTATKKIKASLGLEVTPFHKIKAIDVDSPTQGYVVSGSVYDYARGTHTITMIQKK